MIGSVPRPRETEVMANMLLGRGEPMEPLPPTQPAGVRAALERVLAGALSRPPCVVSFSGGRDSTAVLGLATDVARRQGLALPIPAILRFRAAETNETAWQELVLEHLGLSNAEVLVLSDELDALGPAATEVLRRHGVRWPGNAYMHRPLFEIARGGTLLTGVGGDELFSTTAPRRSVRQLALAALPARLREEVVLRRRPPKGYGWLTSTGLARVRRGLVGDEVRWPYRWDHSLRHWYSSRAFAAIDGGLSLVADGHDVAVINPLLDRQVLAELERAGGPRGFPSRTEAMRWLCGDLLPDAAMSRSTKAVFGSAIWGPAVREFAATWDGGGVDPRYVDIRKLKAELCRPDPDFRTILLLHEAWLHTHALSAARS